MFKNRDIRIETHTIRSYQVDMFADATIIALCDFVQEIAGNDAEARGFGFDDLLRKNIFWVLSRLKVKINRYPKWKDTIKIATWVREIDRIFSVRDFYFLDKNEEILAAASTSWSIIDAERRRPQRIEQNVEIPVMYPEITAIEGHPSKVLPIKEGEKSPVFDVKYTDLDIVGHVNNVIYTEWILNSFDFDFLKKHLVNEYEINFLRESKFGQKMYTQNQCIDNQTPTWLVSIAREANNQEVCRAKVIWRERK